MLNASLATFGHVAVVVHIGPCNFAHIGLTIFGLGCSSDLSAGFMCFRVCSHCYCVTPSGYTSLLRLLSLGNECMWACRRSSALQKDIEPELTHAKNLFFRERWAFSANHCRDVAQDLIKKFPLPTS